MSKRNILIRFDDVCPTMNWEQWEKAMNLLNSINAPALIGVIPDCKDPELQINAHRNDFWEYIKQLQQNGFTIAMHGYNHIYSTFANGIVTKNKKSEFAGIPYEEQLDKIRKGKKILHEHGIDTNVFFAPSHSYDDNTLRALSECGFKYISDGMSARPYVRNGILCLPCRSFGIPKIKGEGYYTAIVHAHEWIRPEKAYGWKQLQRLCMKHQNEIVNFDIFSEWPIGNTFFQRLLERLYILTYRYIVPILSYIKHNILKL